MSECDTKMYNINNCSTVFKLPIDYLENKSTLEKNIHSDLELPFFSNVPFLSKTKHHDDHHSKLAGNYASTFNWMDRIFKTTFKK